MNIAFRSWRKPLIATAACVALFGTAPAALPTHPAAAAASSCTITPNRVVLDQVWTVNAVGLPTSGTVNMIITFPDGAESTGPITVSKNGTFTTTGSSNMTASWGFIAPEQLGTYTYQFVGRVKWPVGTFTKLYAQCSVLVS